MVHETRHVPSVCRINHFIVANAHQISARTIPIFLYFHPAEFGVGAIYFTYILHNESAFANMLASKQSPTLAPTIKRIDITIVLVLEPSVLTTVTHWTSHWITFNAHHSVETTCPTVKCLSLFQHSFVIVITYTHAFVFFIIRRNYFLTVDVFAPFYHLELLSCFSEVSHSFRVSFKLALFLLSTLLLSFCHFLLYLLILLILITFL